MNSTSSYSSLDNILEGFQVISPDLKYLYVNDAVCRQARKSREELLNHSMSEVFPGIENTPMYRKAQESIAKKLPVDMENKFEYPDGSYAWFLLKMEPTPDALNILSIDITKNKATESELQKQLQRLEALREIDLAIINTTSTSQVLKTVLEKVTSILRVDAASILLLDKFCNRLEFAAGRGYRTRGIEKSNPFVGQGHAGKAALNQSTLFIPNLFEDRESFLRWDLIKDENFITYAVTPLISKGKLLGVLEIFNRTQLELDDDWIQFFEALARQSSIAIENGSLFQELTTSNLELMLAYETTIEGWSRALDLRDRETEGHTQRVTEFTLKLAKAAGISGSELVHVRRGALLHDIGKMGVPDSILLKPGPLTDEEWVIMRKHPVFARDLLYPIEYLRPCISIPYSHHEKFDGTGYPQGLKGDQIPLVARLFAVVDVWDALSFDRPYRKAWPEGKVLQYIRSLSGTHFDPCAVETFFKILKTEKTEY